MKQKLLATLGLVGLLSVTGCVMLPAGPGAQEGTTPPKLVVKDGVTQWDNPGNFGPVPAAQATKGAAACGALNTKDLQFIATGYHSKAQDVNGNTIAGGGFYCVRK